MKKKIIISVLAVVLVLAVGLGVYFALPEYDLSEIPEDIQVIEMEGEELRILNLTDIQMTIEEWDTKGIIYEVTTGTITKLIEKEQPDLITVTGDFSYTNTKNYGAYEQFAEFMDSFGIPWAPIWGNHDVEGGDEEIEKIEDIFAKSEYTLFKEGPEELGSGNYTVFISNGKRIVEGLIFMDTHAGSFRINILGNKVTTSAGWLNEKQLDWYKDQIEISKAFGCKDSSIFVHVPIYAYRDARNAAIVPQEEGYVANRDESDNPEYWNKGYKDSFGAIGSGGPKEDDGVLQALKDSKSTKHVFAGHCHKSNCSIVYEGIRLTNCVKTGPAHSWRSDMNGGTVIIVDNKGISDVYHSYIDDYIDTEVRKNFG